MTVDIELSLVDRAREFGAARHARAGQLYGGQPYSVHLEAVEKVLLSFGYTDPVLLAAAWLHDTKEDTGATSEELVALFGDEVAHIVDLVTDKPGKNRRERHTATYPLIAADEKATVLKLADRIANVEACVAARDLGRLRMYQKEHGHFREVLWRPGTGDLWDHLDGLLAKKPKV
jgi:(p)ppGpp synthase/HD superfamily hydrolase